MTAPVQSSQPITERLLVMPSSLNDACRTMEEAANEITALRAKVDELTAALLTARRYCDGNMGPLRSSLLDKIAAVINAALAVNSQHSDGEAGR